MPLGRTARVTSRMPNETAGAQDGPKNVAVRLSAVPSVIAAITMPGKLHRPASTQMEKIRPIYSRPIEGSTGWMMIRQAPAGEAVAIDRPKAMRLILVGLA